MRPPGGALSTPCGRLLALPRGPGLSVRALSALAVRAPAHPQRTHPVHPPPAAEEPDTCGGQGRTANIEQYQNQNVKLGFTTLKFTKRPALDPLPQLAAAVSRSQTTSPVLLSRARSLAGSLAGSIAHSLSLARSLARAVVHVPGATMKPRPTIPRLTRSPPSPHLRLWLRQWGCGVLCCTEGAFG